MSTCISWNCLWIEVIFAISLKCNYNSKHCSGPGVPHRAGKSVILPWSAVCPSVSFVFSLSVEARRFSTINYLINFFSARPSCPENWKWTLTCKLWQTCRCLRVLRDFLVNIHLQFSKCETYSFETHFLEFLIACAYVAVIFLYMPSKICRIFDILFCIKPVK